MGGREYMTVSYTVGSLTEVRCVSTGELDAYSSKRIVNPGGKGGNGCVWALRGAPGLTHDPRSLVLDRDLQLSLRERNSSVLAGGYNVMSSYPVCVTDPSSSG
jgi:hypothetical protein